MKKIFLALIAIIILFAGYNAWFAFVNYRFETITENKVYKSGLIKPSRLEDFLLEHNIQTVINFLIPTVQDEENPADQSHIDAEDAAIKAINQKHNTNISHINIPSNQVPTKETLTKFFEILDNPKSYPVLIHCYHGVGRAKIYSAIYRIEYENWSNKDARAKTRLVLEALGYKSSFADGKPKGDFLMQYRPRRDGNLSTISQIK
jgi:protein tyrosine/serine phosphatase